MKIRNLLGTGHGKRLGKEENQLHETGVKLGKQEPHARIALKKMPNAHRGKQETERSWTNMTSTPPRTTK